MEVARHWRLKQQRYRLVGEMCPHCDVKIFPPRDICPRCGGGTLKNNLDIQIRSVSPDKILECRTMLAGSKDYNLIMTCFEIDKEIRRIGKTKNGR